VLPYSTADLARFLVEMRFTNPIFEKMLRRIREQLADIQQVGSLLRIENELRGLVEEQRTKDTQRRKAKSGNASDQPALWSADEQAALDAEHYSLLEVQLIQALDFFRQQAAGQGENLRFFTGEAAKSLRVLDLLLRRYDVVLANPPYLSRGNMNEVMTAFLDDQYPDAKGDLYAAFIARCAELAEEFGRVGMITQQSFMFTSSYEELRNGIKETFAIETMVHTGPHAFPEIQGEKVNTTAFTLRRDMDATRRKQNIGTYYRFVHEKDADSKRIAFEQALAISDSSLATNAYSLPQEKFDVIPGCPWVYWITNELRKNFTNLQSIKDVADVKLGLSSIDMERFYRFWWETGINNKWWVLQKGGTPTKWYESPDWVTNWSNDGKEQKIEVIMRYPYLKGNYGLKVRDEKLLGQEGLTYSRKGSHLLSVRYMPSGHIFEDNGPAVLVNRYNMLEMLGILNSKIANYFAFLMNPGIDFQKGDIERLPVCDEVENNPLSFLKPIYLTKHKASTVETSGDFIVPLHLSSSIQTLSNLDFMLGEFEKQLNDHVFNLYKVSTEDKQAIELEMSGGILDEVIDDVEITEIENNGLSQNPELQEFAARWVSYAIGIALGRFQPGKAKSLGNAIYSRESFAIGSLPAPSEEEFNELVGTPEQFAYVDEHGGRHIFSAQVEKSLQALAVEDGISVLEPGHPRDLVVRVEKALTLMLGEQGVREVVAALGGEASAVEAFLRQFLAKDYFTKWHFKWYRKRPIYWAIQSAKRNYTFILFHERITRDTFYAIQREPYLDVKRNAVALKIGDLQAAASTSTGSARKRLEKETDDLRKLSAELEEFAKELESITLGGYNPAPDWIDDGVILRMAPLWKVIPLWKAEPKKYWERLEAGDFDWSRMAMNYWSKRVKEKCKVNKSYAIAHGHEEWYEGNS
jgi:hypothetical protein